ncbi:MAG: TonB-dependent receptor [Calditrichaeota bacterium]|nr:MAG: TonB-dependent receptor [Calditrichota bacterium]
MFKARKNILWMVALVPGICWAGVTGKISGKVTDAKTGEPLIGANVIVEGTNMGAAVGQDGTYFILQVPPGTYTLRAQMIGYATVVKKNVVVQVDLTTEVNFQLSESFVEGEEVVVVAERPLVQKDITAKISVVTSEEIEAMPVTDFRDAVKIQGGFTDGLHLRGGRLNSIGYMIDGLDVSNPLIGNYGGVQDDRSLTLGLADNQLFAGSYVTEQNTSNYDGILLDKNAVQEIQVLTGTFNAEYGRALSGIVNVVTKDPSPEFKFQIEYLSPMVNSSPYRRVNGVAIDENPGPNDSLRYRPWKLQDHFSQLDRQLLGQLRGSMSGALPLLPKTTFFLSGRMLNENSYLPFGYNIVREFFQKVAYNPGGAFKFSFTGHQTRKYWQPYNHDWKYLPDHYSHFRRFSNRYSFLLTHSISANTYYTFKVSRFATDYKRNVPGLRLVINREDYPDFDPIITDYQQPERWENGFFYRGHDIQVEDSHTVSWNFKWDITSQFHKSHQVKAGFDLLDHKIQQFIYLRPYPGGVHEFQDYLRRPLEVSAYIQDKIEYNFLIVNIGVRMDYFNPNGLGKGSRFERGPNYPYDNKTVTMWPDIYLPGFVNDDGKFEYFPEQKAQEQIYFSPRIGVSHPVTENLAFHFAYGHFVQRPDFRDIFYSHDIQRFIALAGNPNAKMQKTIAFEAGLKQAIGDYVAVDVSFYYRDIFDLLGTQWVNFFPFQYAVFNNSDYANAKGFEISINKRYSSYFSANLNYTFLIARGNENTSRTGVKFYWGSTNDRLRPRRDFYLDWDRRHTIGGNINFWFPYNEGPTILGKKLLGGTKIGLLFTVKSGLPYTPTQRAVGDWDFWLRILQTNSSRRPWTYQVDVDISKEFHLGSSHLIFFSRITNLLNTDNALWVYTNTGRLWDAGPQSSRSADFIRDPSAKGPPRQIRLGMRLEL